MSAMLPAAAAPRSLAPSAKPALIVDHLKAYYQTSAFGLDRDVRAVDEVSLTIDRGEIYGIAGESSSGKTSLIKAIVGAIRPPLKVVGGSVTFNFAKKAYDIYAMPPAKLQAIRWRHLSYIMQGSMNVLNPVRRIRHSFYDFAFSHMALGRAAFWEKVREHLAKLGLSPSVLDAYPHELSGSMRQRTTIALATVCTPEFIVADEPTTALDVIVQREVLSMLRDIQRNMGSSFLFVTHDMSVHATVSDRIGIVYAGRLIEEAPTPTLFSAARHPYSQHLVASMPRIGDTTRRPSLAGRPPNLADPPPGCRFHPRCPIAMDICRKEAPPLVEWAPRHRVACFAVGGSNA